MEVTPQSRTVGVPTDPWGPREGDSLSARTQRQLHCIWNRVSMCTQAEGRPCIRGHCCHQVHAWTPELSAACGRAFIFLITVPTGCYQPSPGSRRDTSDQIFLPLWGNNTAQPGKAQAHQKLATSSFRGASPPVAPPPFPQIVRGEKQVDKMKRKGQDSEASTETK